MGIANDYGVSSLLDITIPRGSEYSRAISFHNPSKDKKIRIHRIGSSDESALEVISHFTPESSIAFQR